MTATAPSLTEPAAAFELRLPWRRLTPESAVFAQAWSRWRGTRLMPRRSDIDLGEIKKLLPTVVLLETRSPTEVVFRVAGSRLRDYLGVDVTGLNYIDLTPPAFRDIRIWRLEQERTRPCGALFLYPHRFPSGHLAAVEALGLPIEHDEPGQPPLLMSVNTTMSNRSEDPPAGTKPTVFVSDQFRFIDIGAGIPARTEP